MRQAQAGQVNALYSDMVIYECATSKGSEPIDIYCMLLNSR